MTDQELATAIREVIARHDQEVTAAVESLRNTLHDYWVLLREAHGQGLRVSGAGGYPLSLDLNAPALAVIGYVDITKMVKL